MTRGLHEIVWAVNPGNDNLESFLVYLGQYVDEFLHAANFKFRLDIPTEFANISMDSSVRHHLFCGVREALNNIVKYAGPCEVFVSASMEGDCLKVEVVDSGKGFDPSAVTAIPGRRNGLANMRRRMEEAGGAVEVHSALGKGTRIVFRAGLRHA